MHIQREAIPNLPTGALIACLSCSLFGTICGMKAFHTITVLLATVFCSPIIAYGENNILVFGDSLSAGHGIAVAESWPHLLQLELQRNHPGFNVVNASISGETSLGGRQRIVKALKEHRPAFLILELGSNDGLRGYPNTETEANLGEIIKEAKLAHTSILLIGMRLPPNYGATYTKQFQDIFTSLSKKYRVRLMEFLLEGVKPEQFQPDNLHPTAGAQPLIMNSVLKELEPLLKND